MRDNAQQFLVLFGQRPDNRRLDALLLDPMPVVEAEIDLALPQEQAFALTQDYYVRLEWDPFLKDMRFLDGAQEAAVGVKVWVKAWTGLTMTVEYISLKPPSVVAMQMLEGPWFFEKFAGTWRFRPLEAERSQVIFRYSFTTRWPRLRPLLDPIITKLFSHDIRARLQGLKRAAEETDIIARVGEPSTCA